MERKVGRTAPWKTGGGGRKRNKKLLNSLILKSDLAFCPLSLTFSSFLSSNYKIKALKSKTVQEVIHRADLAATPFIHLASNHGINIFKRRLITL